MRKKWVEKLSGIPGVGWLLQSWRVHRRRQELHKEINTVRRSYRPLYEAAKDDDNKIQELEAGEWGESHDYYDELQTLEWSALARTARGLGIHVPGAALTPAAKLAKRIGDARFSWWSRWVGLLMPPLSLLVALGGLWIARQQLPEQKAVLHLDFREVEFLKRAPGQFLVRPTVAVRNDGTSRAGQVAMEFQHWPLSWTGVIPAGQTFDISPGESKTFSMQEDTVADPPGTLASGKHLYFAVRTNWVSSATGKRGCAVYYLDLHEAMGMQASERVLLRDVQEQAPAGIPPSDIANCS
jgi:hypothetical protein